VRSAPISVNAGGQFDQNQDRRFRDVVAVERLKRPASALLEPRLHHGPGSGMKDAIVTQFCRWMADSIAAAISHF